MKGLGCRAKNRQKTHKRQAFFFGSFDFIYKQLVAQWKCVSGGETNFWWATFYIKGGVQSPLQFMS